MESSGSSKAHPVSFLSEVLVLHSLCLKMVSWSVGFVPLKREVDPASTFSRLGAAVPLIDCQRCFCIVSELPMLRGKDVVTTLGGGICDSSEDLLSWFCQKRDCALASAILLTIPVFRERRTGPDCQEFRSLSSGLGRESPDMAAAPGPPPTLHLLGRRECCALGWTHWVDFVLIFLVLKDLSVQMRKTP